MKWTGLTGGIATGKSTAKKLLEGLGYPVVDADQISHRLTESGEAGYVKVVSHFGREILTHDQTLDRKKLSQLVFSDPQLKSVLEDILHPLIRAEVAIQRGDYEKKGVDQCFYDVPLLFEKKLKQEFDTTVLIWCDQQTQIQRLINRSQLADKEAHLRISNQLPLIEKVKMADYCIDNNGTIEDLAKQLRWLVKVL